MWQGWGGGLRSPIRKGWGTTVSAMAQAGIPLGRGLLKSRDQIQIINTTDDPKEVKQLYGEKNISCWEGFKWEFKRRLVRISKRREERSVWESENSNKRKQWFDWQKCYRFVFRYKSKHKSNPIYLFISNFFIFIFRVFINISHYFIIFYFYFIIQVVFALLLEFLEIIA